MMDAESIQAWATLANSASALTIALVFAGYLIRQVARRDDLIFEDWKRQRDKELSIDNKHKNALYWHVFALYKLGFHKL